MFVYLVNILLIILWGIYLVYYKPTQLKKKLFCAIATLQWVLISGLRGLSVGADTLAYGISFWGVRSRSWSSILNDCLDVYIYAPFVSNFNKVNLPKDPGYVLFQKLVHIFTDNYQVYLIIVAIIIFGSLAYFIYDNSDDLVFSYIMFSCLFYSFFAITGIRQALATALIVFIGFHFIKERNLRGFLLVAILAYMLHKSAIVFVPFYFLAIKKITWNYIIVITIGAAFFLSLGQHFVLTMGALLGYDRDTVYQASTSGYTVAILLVALGVSVFHKQVQMYSISKKSEINATIIAGLLTLFTLVDQSVMRVQQYYALFIMLSIPNLWNCFKKKSSTLVRIGCAFVLILYLIRNNPQYVFFWQ